MYACACVYMDHSCLIQINCILFCSIFPVIELLTCVGSGVKNCRGSWYGDFVTYCFFLQVVFSCVSILGASIPPTQPSILLSPSLLPSPPLFLTELRRFHCRKILQLKTLEGEFFKHFRHKYQHVYLTV